MSTTLTLQIPDPVMARLREQSKISGRPIDETALRALEAGLAETGRDDWWRDLGTLVAAPPTKRYDPEQIRRLQEGLHIDPEGLLQELERERGTDAVPPPHRG